jgi:hypothetical protein
VAGKVVYSPVTGFYKQDPNIGVFGQTTSNSTATRTSPEDDEIVAGLCVFGMCVGVDHDIDCEEEWALRKNYMLINVSQLYTCRLSHQQKLRLRHMTSTNY